MKSRLITAAGFLLLAGFYAVSQQFRMPMAAVSIALPAMFLAVACAAGGTRERGERFWIAAALLLSGMGDLMGGLHRFIPQIIFFALAHAAYTGAFVRGSEWRFTPRIAIIPLVAIAAVLLGREILSHISDPAEKIAVAIYIVIISVMTSAAAARGWGHAAAAAVFMLSDSIIAWNRFVCRIPHATLWIMTSYYAAQLSFALLCLKGIGIRHSCKTRPTR